MTKVNIKDIEERRRQSPNGKFGRASKDISIALGRDPESFDLRKRHPFDLALIRIPGGKTLCPGEEDFVYYVIADNPRGDSCYYPDSGKFAVMKEANDEVIVKGKETDYFDGEE
jgi:hypothetical protein